MKRYIQLNDEMKTVLNLSELFYIKTDEDESEIKLLFDEQVVILDYKYYKPNERDKILKKDLENIKSLIYIESEFVPKSELINQERSSDEEIERIRNEFERYKDKQKYSIELLRQYKKDLEHDLLLIKSKWWYKLFNLFSH